MHMSANFFAVARVDINHNEMTKFECGGYDTRRQVLKFNFLLETPMSVAPSNLSMDGSQPEHMGEPRSRNELQK